MIQRTLLRPALRPWPAAVTLLLISIACRAGADYVSTVLSQNPIGYWRLEETNAPSPASWIATNSGSLGQAGAGIYTNVAMLGVPGALAGATGNAAAYFDSFNYTANRVRIPYQPEWNVNGPFSVEFWAKPAQTGSLASPAASTTFAGPGGGTRSGWLIYQGNGALSDGNGWYFRLYRSASGTANRSAAASLPINTSAWYHVVGTFDGTNISLYVNGTLASSVALNDTYRPVTDPGAPMTFGSRSDGAGDFGWFSYAGSLDEAAFYTNALGPTRVLAHYLAGINPAPLTPYPLEVLADAPVGYWRLNETLQTPNVPPAVNSGSQGAADNGYYLYPSMPGLDGPRPPNLPGFSANNQCVGLSGTNSRVILPPLHLNTNTVTITAWLKRNGDQPGNTGIVLSHTRDTAAGLKFDQSQQELSYNWGDAEETVSLRSYLEIPDDQWVFVALIVHPQYAVLALQDGTDFRCVTNFATHTPALFEYETRIGSDLKADARTLNGAIDEVAIFDRALSVGDVYSQYAAAAGNVAPRIFAMPVIDPAQPFAGNPLVLTSDAGGTAPLGYQWRKDGAEIPGATNSTCQITAAQTGDSGDYDVVVTNAYGTATSDPLSVTVSPSSEPVILRDPDSRTLYPTSVAPFTVSAAGSQLKYRWFKNGGALSAATNASYTIANVSAGDAGSYTVVVSNSVGSVTSAPAVLTIATAAAGSFEASILQDQPHSWWRLDEASGTTNMFDAFGRHDGFYTHATLGAPGVVGGAVHFTGNGHGMVPYTHELNRHTFTIEVWAKAPASSSGIELAAVSSFSSIGEGYGRGIGFTKSSVDFWRGINGNLFPNQIYLYNNLDFFVPDQWTHWAVTVSDDAVSWYLNGEFKFGPFPYAYVKDLAAPFYIGALQPGGTADSFWIGDIDEVVYYDTALSPDRIQAHYVDGLFGTTTAPLFLSEPRSQTVLDGSPAEFSGQAAGSIPIHLQWLWNGVPIPGATNNILALPAVSFAQQGSYVLAASNPVGSNNSAPATLTVMPIPTFANLTNGLVLHLRFDGNLADSSGRGNDGSVAGSGNVALVPGMLGQALHYYSDADSHDFNYVTLGWREDLQFSSNVNFSVSYWIRTPPNEMSGFLPFLSSAHDGLDGPGYTFSPDYPGWVWSLNDVNQNSVYGFGGPAINDGEWHHLVHTFTRGGFTLTFVDGNLMNFQSTGGFNDLDTGTPPNDEPTNIGQSSSGVLQESGEAEIDDLGIWRRALTTYEAQSIYFAGKNQGQSFDVYGPVRVNIQRAGQDLDISWQAGTLLQSGTPTGPWTPVPGAVAPHCKVTPGPASKFYRVQL